MKCLPQLSPRPDAGLCLDVCVGWSQDALTVGLHQVYAVLGHESSLS